MSAENISTSNSATDETSNSNRSTWLDWLLLAAVLVACSLAMSNNLAEPDLWGHIQYARDAMQNGLPATATYTYTAEGYPWINHELLSEFALAIGYDTFGVPGLMVLKTLLGVLVMWLIIDRSSKLGVSEITKYLMATLVAANLTFFWILRPQLFSFVFFALLIVLLNWCFAGWEGGWHLSPHRLRKDKIAPPEINYSSPRMRYLWLAPVILFLWANTHGAFLAGLCIFIAYLCCRSVEAVSCGGWEAIGLLKRFAMMIVAAILATFLNPYTWRLHAWLIESLIPPRPEIIEWLPPQVTWEVTSLAWLPFWLMLLLGALSLVFSRKPKDFTHLVLLSLLTWQSLAHRRHIALLAILFAFWMPTIVQGFFERLGIGKTSESFSAGLSRNMRWVFGAAFALVLSVGGMALVDQMRMIQVFRGLYPVSAFDYIAARKLQGKMVVAFDWAQYAIMAFGAENKNDPGLRFQFDGRYDTCYPREIVDMHFDFEMGDGHYVAAKSSENDEYKLFGYELSDPKPGSRFRDPRSPPMDSEVVLKFNDPELVLLNRKCGQALKSMEHDAERWTLLYQDRLAQLWGLKEKYGNPASSHFIPIENRNISNEPQRGTVAWPALPEPKPLTSQLVRKDDPKYAQDQGNRSPE